MDFLKASIIISTGCSVVLTGVSVYCAKQSAELNRIINKSTERMITDNAEIKSFMHTAKK